MTDPTRLTQRYTGRAGYLPDYELDHERLLIAIPCLLQGRPPTTFALLDTASTWSVLPAALALRLGYDLYPDPAVPGLLTARHGLVRGRLERLWIRFPAEDGDDLDVDALCFLSADWTGPTVIGWKGCLEGVRLGLDPAEDAFYFGAL